MRVVFRTDASSQIGIGHVMRCMTLANELRRHGCEILFICRTLHGDMNRYLSDKGFQVCPIVLPECQAYDWQADASLTLKAVSQCQGVDWLVVDHYQLSDRWESVVKLQVGAVMVIDDLANRRHDCALLLDQNYYSDMTRRYDGLLPEYCQALLGPEHVLFREEFMASLKNIRKRDGSVSNVLVFFGGGDVEGLTRKAIRALARFDENTIHVDVVVGASNPLNQKIRSLCESLENFTFYCQTEKMAELINKADICLGAGGATTWERAVLGLPTITVVCADNQLNTTQDIADIGAILYIGRAEDVSVEQLFDTLKNLIQNPNKVFHLSQKVKGLMGEVSDRLESTAVKYLTASMKH